ncbi:Protein yippee [Fasciolopsis buskii]|uniref:Protein yippee n=1 Tax=Fasciolopsis buskii TaxID=27845 RepID=A0A8E0RNY4_9TREM|nr:Protein yippee [Fasciolopsis buski]
MVKAKFQEYFPSKPNFWTYSCLHCRAHLARHQDLISKSFQGSQGRAYLFNQVVNVDYSEAKQRVLLTGIHFVSDVFCSCCNVMLGWRYERAFEPSQRYKEGKVIVELAHLIKDNCWDSEWLVPVRPSALLSQPTRRQTEESTTSMSLPLPPSPLPRLRFSWSPTACSLNYQATSSERSNSEFGHITFEPNPDTTGTLPVSVCASPIFSSPPDTSSCYGLTDRRTLSPGPSSSSSSCCSRTPEQPSWFSGFRLLRPDCPALVSGTAAHGPQPRANTPPIRCSRTLKSRSTSSGSKSFTLPMNCDRSDENRGRSTKRRPPLGLRGPFGCTTITPGVSGSKPRVRLRSAFARRASSSSPSRAFLLPLVSDDESDQSVGDPVQSIAACGDRGTPEVYDPTSGIKPSSLGNSQSANVGRASQ